jgi:hypothetical protein
VENGGSFERKLMVKGCEEVLMVEMRFNERLKNLAQGFEDGI